MAKSDAAREHVSTAQAEWSKALLNFSKKLYNRAMLNIREAIHQDPSYLEEARAQLSNYLRSGQPEKAIAVGLAVIEFDTKNFRLMNEIGNAYRQREEYKKAFQMYQGALKVNPKFDFARYNMAACYFKVPTMDENLVRQTRIVEQFVVFRRTGYQLKYEDSIPGFKNQEMPSRFKLGTEIEVVETDVEAAEMWIAHFEEQSKKHPDSWKHQFDLAVLYDVARFGELALQYYHKAETLHPNSNMIETNLAIAYAEYKEDFEKAKYIFFNILKKEVCDRTTLLNLAILHRRMKKPFTMLKYYVYVGELLTKSHGLFHLDEMIKAADQCYQKNERDKAISLYQALLEERKNPEWTFRLGMIYKFKRQTKLALEFWRKTLEIDPGFEAAHEELDQYVNTLEEEAQDLIDDNFLTDAASLLEEIISIYPRVSDYEILADVYEELGEKDRADEYAREAQKLAKSEK
ncbi:MAG: tetratricopeptide repeat protein [SAR324 cluster bacterium]|nr:tetratricopeptide repeat protein [SAR324 cluster bacterium]